MHVFATSAPGYIGSALVPELTFAVITSSAWPGPTHPRRSSTRSAPKPGAVTSTTSTA